MDKLYVHYLCKLMTYRHQICTAGASDVDAAIDRFTSGLTYYSRLHGSKCKKSNFGYTTVAQIVTAAHRDL